MPTRPTFEEALDELIDDYNNDEHASEDRDNMIAALELKLMALKEEQAAVDPEED